VVAHGGATFGVTNLSGWPVWELYGRHVLEIVGQSTIVTVGYGVALKLLTVTFDRDLGGVPRQSMWFTV
jgi:hypothetical protein